MKSKRTVLADLGSFSSLRSNDTLDVLIAIKRQSPLEGEWDYV
jgi:hypothetical protein